MFSIQQEAGLLSSGEKEMLQLAKEKILEPESGFKIEHYAFLAGNEAHQNGTVQRRKERAKLPSKGGIDLLLKNELSGLSNFINSRSQKRKKIEVKSLSKEKLVNGLSEALQLSLSYEIKQTILFLHISLMNTADFIINKIELQVLSKGTRLLNSSQWKVRLEALTSKTSRFFQIPYVFQKGGDNAEIGWMVQTKIAPDQSLPSTEIIVLPSLKYTISALDLFKPNYSCQHSRAKFEYVFSKLLLNYQRHVRVISKPWQILKQLKEINKFAITFSEGMGRQMDQPALQDFEYNYKCGLLGEHQFGYFTAILIMGVHSNFDQKSQAKFEIRSNDSKFILTVRHHFEEIILDLLGSSLVSLEPHK